MEAYSWARIDNFGTLSFVEVDEVNIVENIVIATVVNPPIPTRVNDPLLDKKVVISLERYKQYLQDREPIFNWYFLED